MHERVSELSSGVCSVISSFSVADSPLRQTRGRTYRFWIAELPGSFVDKYFSLFTDFYVTCARQPQPPPLAFNTQWQRLSQPLLFKIRMKRRRGHQQLIP